MFDFIKTLWAKLKATAGGLVAELGATFRRAGDKISGGVKAAFADNESALNTVCGIAVTLGGISIIIRRPRAGFAALSAGVGLAGLRSVLYSREKLKALDRDHEYRMKQLELQK